MVKKLLDTPEMNDNQTLSDFKETVSQKPMYVAYFSTPQCNVCKVLRPKVEELVEQYENIGFVYLNTVEKPEIAGQFTVFSVPTVIIFAEGREYKRLSRSFSIDEIQDYFERLLSLLS